MTTIGRGKGGARRGRATPIDTGDVRVGRDGTSVSTHSSRVFTSGAMPGESGNATGSAAGTLSMTVRRVSVVVP